MASIHKHILKDGTSVRWHAFWRDGSGKQHKRVFTRRKDAAAFLTETKKEVQDGTWREIQSAPMQEVFQAWLTDLDIRVKMGEVKPSTAAGYRCAVRRFAEEFGGHRSDQFSARAVVRWRHGCAERIAAGEMAPKSFNNTLNLLHSILEWARHPARAYLKHDPLVGQKRLTIRRPEANFLEDEEIAALVGAVADDAQANAIIHVALFAGLRRGEIFGLKWEDIETSDHGGRLRVRRSVYQGKITMPKTANSERIVEVPRRVLDVLERHRAAGAPSVDGDFIFRTAKGTPIDPDNFYGRRFAKLRAQAELRSSIGMHTLRHTYASLLLRQGEHPKFGSRQLGHASTSFTMDVYGHLFRATSEEAMDRLQDTIRATQRSRFQVVQGGRRDA